MKGVYLIGLYLAISAVFVEAGFKTPMRTKIIGKFRSMITAWLTEAQFNTLFDNLEPQMNADTKPEDLQGMLITQIMGITTLGQKLSIAGIGTKFLTKPGGFTKPMEILATILTKNIAAFATQMSDTFARFNARGETRARIFQRSYRMIDIFMTKKRVGIIYCRISKAIDAWDITMGPFIETTLAPIVLFSVLNGLEKTYPC